MPSVRNRLCMIPFAGLACIGCGKTDREVVNRQSSAVDSFAYKPDPRHAPGAGKKVD